MVNDGHNPDIENFLTACQQAFTANSLQRLILSKYKGVEPELNRITIRPVQIKEQKLLSFLYEYRTNHVTKNLPVKDAIAQLQQWLGSDFHNAHMITDEWETQLSFSKKGKVLVNKNRNKNSAKTIDVQSPQAELAHNRNKLRYVEQNRPYLRELGITDANGQIIPAMSRKWKQINKFI